MATERTPRRLRFTHWLAIALPLAALATWSFETARHYSVGASLQGAVEQAAMEGANHLGNAEQVKRAANVAAARNPVLDETVRLRSNEIQMGYLVDGGFQPVIDDPENAHAVRVSHTHHYDMLLGPIFGFRSVAVTRSAVAIGSPNTASRRPAPPVMTTRDTSGW